MQPKDLIPEGARLVIFTGGEPAGVRGFNEVPPGYVRVGLGQDPSLGDKEVVFVAFPFSQINLGSKEWCLVTKTKAVQALSDYRDKATGVLQHDASEEKPFEEWSP